MKKTALTRKSTMKRTGIKRNVKTAIGTRKKGLAPRSPKRRKEDKAVNDLAEFTEIFVGQARSFNGVYRMCWLCRDNWATEVNHIAGRASKIRHHRCNLSAVCASCHRDIVPVIGVPGMFAFKRLRDPDGFDAAIMRELLRAKTGRVA